MLLIAGFVYGFEKINTFKLTNLPSKTQFSVIIPFRNEAENLPQLLESIASITISKTSCLKLFLWMMILMMIRQKLLKSSRYKILRKEFTRTDIKVISNERKTNSPKKDAITTAINHAKNEWIITTDADCILT